MYSLCQCVTRAAIHGVITYTQYRLKAFYFEPTAGTATSGTLETVMGLRLTIDAARRQDGGLYVCTAQNAFGSDTANVQLTVVEPPEPPTKILLDGVGSRTLTLSWNVEFDGNSPLTAIIIELCNDTGQFRRQRQVAVCPLESLAPFQTKHSSYTSLPITTDSLRHFFKIHVPKSYSLCMRVLY